MDVSKKTENYFRVSRVVLDEIPIQLRGFFIKKWNYKFPTETWDGTPSSGSLLLNKMPGSAWKKLEKHVQDAIQSGDSDTWDCTVLFQVLLFSEIGLIDSLRKKAKRKGPLRESEQIDILREIRNQISHTKSMEISDKDFSAIFQKFRKVFTDLSLQDEELKAIECKVLETKDMKRLRAVIEQDTKAEIEKNPEDFHNLPQMTPGFVGRDLEIMTVLNNFNVTGSFQIIDIDADVEGQFSTVLIHGGPGFGKSTLALNLGYQLGQQKYNYVVWIDVRDITNAGRSHGAPDLETLAVKILQEFDVNVRYIEENAKTYLKQKLRFISSECKNALLILDNADALVSSYHQKTTNDTLSQLIQLAHNCSSDNIKIILTSRIKSNNTEQIKNIEIKHFTTEESDRYLGGILNRKSYVHTDLTERLVKLSKGMPLALKILAAVVNATEDKDVLENYLQECEKSPIRTIGEGNEIGQLFETSLRYLTKEELYLMKVLAVFPGRFSYPYLKQMSKVLDFEPLVITKLKAKSLVEWTDSTYVLHPFLLEFLRQNEWKDPEKEKFENCFILVYGNAFFDLASESLEKDKYEEHLRIFVKERHNFRHLVKLLKVKEVITDEACKKVFNRETSDYHSLSIIIRGFLPKDTIIEFLKECEEFASERYKVNVWCCKYDLLKAHQNRKIPKPKNYKVDEYGEIILTRRKLRDDVFAHRSHDIRKLMQKMLGLQRDVEKIEGCKTKAYLISKCCKQIGHLCKKDTTERIKAVEYYKKGLETAKDAYGNNWITIESYLQLAKCYWALQKFTEAFKIFDTAGEMARNMKDSETYGNYLLDYGRCLYHSGIEANEEKGVKMVQESLKTFDNGNVRCRLNALNMLTKHDPEYFKEILQPLLDNEDPNYHILNMVLRKFRVDSNVEDLRKLMHHFKENYQKKKDDFKRSFDILQALLNWQIALAKASKSEIDEVRKMKDLAKEALRKCTEGQFGAFYWCEIMKFLTFFEPDHYQQVLPYLKKQKSPSKYLMVMVTKKFQYDKSNINSQEAAADDEVKDTIQYIINVYEENKEKPHGIFQLLKGAFVWSRMFDVGGEIQIKVRNVAVEALQRFDRSKDRYYWCETMIYLMYEDRKYFDMVLDYLEEQRVPTGKLLSELTKKFERQPVNDQASSFEDMIKAAEALANTCQQTAWKQKIMLIETLYSWNKLIAVKSHLCLSATERGVFAARAIDWLNQTSAQSRKNTDDQDVNELKKLANHGKKTACNII